MKLSRALFKVWNEACERSQKLLQNPNYIIISLPVEMPDLTYKTPIDW
jgi:hypothetical protein